MGLLTCPNCKFKAGTLRFKKSAEPPSPPSSVAAGVQTPGDGESETGDAGESKKDDSVEDSKDV